MPAALGRGAAGVPFPGLGIAAAALLLAAAVGVRDARAPRRWAPAVFLAGVLAYAARLALLAPRLRARLDADATDPGAAPWLFLVPLVTALALVLLGGWLAWTGHRDAPRAVPHAGPDGRAAR